MYYPQLRVIIWKGGISPAQIQSIQSMLRRSIKTSPTILIQFLGGWVKYRKFKDINKDDVSM